MADHNTLIGSTTGEIEGGTALIGGVLREIESGLVLAGGVAREIEFASEKQCVLTISLAGAYGSASGAKNYAYVTINGKKYTSAASVEVPEGTQVTCFAKATGAGVTAIIKLNDTTVKSGKYTSIEYIHTVTKNTRYELYAPYLYPAEVGSVRIFEE